MYWKVVHWLPTAPVGRLERDGTSLKACISTSNATAFQLRERKVTVSMRLDYLNTAFAKSRTEVERFNG